MSARETLRAVDEQRAKFVDEARAAALQKAQEVIRELRELGLHYRLVEEMLPAPGGAGHADPPAARTSSSFDQSLLGS